MVFSLEKSLENNEFHNIGLVYAELFLEFIFGFVLWKNILKLSILNLMINRELKCLL